MNEVTAPLVVTAPIVLLFEPAYHVRPSAPVVMAVAFGVPGWRYCVIVCAPVGSIAATLLVSSCVNQSLPSEPAVMSNGSLLAAASYSAKSDPSGLMAPIRSAFSANHTRPSGPAAMPRGWLLACGSGNSRNSPVVVTRPTLLPSSSVNHSAPSGPAAMPHGSAFCVGTWNVVSSPVGVKRSMSFVPFAVNHMFPSGPAVIRTGFEPLGRSLTWNGDGRCWILAKRPSFGSVTHTSPLRRIRYCGAASPASGTVSVRLPSGESETTWFVPLNATHSRPPPAVMPDGLVFGPSEICLSALVVTS